VMPLGDANCSDAGQWCTAEMLSVVHCNAAYSALFLTPQLATRTAHRCSQHRDQGLELVLHFRGKLKSHQGMASLHTRRGGEGGEKCRSRGSHARDRQEVHRVGWEGLCVYMCVCDVSMSLRIK